MQVPLQITFRHIKHSDALEAAVREKAAKLESLCPDLSSCRVVIDEEGLHKQQGRRISVHIDLRIPGHEFAVVRSHEDAMVAVRDAYEAARRKLEEEARLLRGGR
ncbi:MAG: HPF/RaiA family ribosome-associated protein [Burkholderiales bacterium]